MHFSCAAHIILLDAVHYYNYSVGHSYVYTCIGQWNNIYDCVSL